MSGKRSGALLWPTCSPRARRRLASPDTCICHGIVQSTYFISRLENSRVAFRSALMLLQRLRTRSNRVSPWSCWSGGWVQQPLSTGLSSWPPKSPSPTGLCLLVARGDFRIRIHNENLFSVGLGADVLSSRRGLESASPAIEPSAPRRLERRFGEVGSGVPTFSSTRLCQEKLPPPWGGRRG